MAMDGPAEWAPDGNVTCHLFTCVMVKSTNGDVMGTKSDTRPMHNLPTVATTARSTKKWTALAEELGGTTRADLWPKLIASAPSVGECQGETTRQIPLFVLTREDSSSACSNPTKSDCAFRRSGGAGSS